jgi:hypothetical protein
MIISLDLSATGRMIGGRIDAMVFFFISEPPDLPPKALNLIRNCLRGRVRRNFGTLSEAG